MIQSVTNGLHDSQTQAQRQKFTAERIGWQRWLTHVSCANLQRKQVEMVSERWWAALLSAPPHHVPTATSPPPTLLTPPSAVAALVTITCRRMLRSSSIASTTPTGIDFCAAQLAASPSAWLLSGEVSMWAQRLQRFGKHAIAHIRWAACAMCAAAVMMTDAGSQCGHISVCSPSQVVSHAFNKCTCLGPASTAETFWQNFDHGAASSGSITAR